MTYAFDPEIQRAVLAHMNDDHRDDNVLIARAFGDGAPVASARMTGFDGDGGDWTVAHEGGATVGLRVPWPGGSIAERREVRREIVALYDEACRRLGIEPRPHGEI
ncbi:MAG: hypothetical protein BGO45_15920 [Microbacterium sp. 71-36]|uniref:DUF2470 domain-containing protein n=1 Tax=unclassified Microbacterium TaxID=2609290 RepID=UPI00086CA876|nr:MULTISPECIES: DUF2470 domain-containing protein [unclassified Microbacterium]MBN9211855.1 DUF2470 domain-containing protein [Microbacterium sp.]ODT40138.1 MAG: hypothetical protein ABS60_04990 [Microbacterium sp. SCN 71-17]ODU49003.1 MAG: hypothetical protein ABT07_05200 [Microbacterium sp. SCN 70-10]OJV78152.1 MAG: hypothetical protein BGO45_15920 [Microbacterium sp. 71-36]